MSDIAVVSEASYPTQVLQAEGPVLVKFGSKTCGPCMMLGAALKDIAPDYGDEIKLFDVDVEEAPGIAKQYGIVTIPVLLFLRNGEVQKRVMGNQTRGKLSQMIDAHIEGGN
ncbi:thioredoxin family protein [Roseateles sp. P5_E11]